MSRVVVLSLLPSLLVAACGGGGGSMVASAQLQLCVDETNRYRAMDGKPPIERSAALESYATVGAQVDTEQQRAHGHFGDTAGGGIATTENVCPAWLGWPLGEGADPEGDAIKACLQAFYDEGPGTGDFHAHYNNLMGSTAHIGCGVYVLEGNITIIQDFGP